MRQAKHLMYWGKCDAQYLWTAANVMQIQFLWTKLNLLQQSDVRGMQFERTYRFQHVI